MSNDRNPREQPSEILSQEDMHQQDVVFVEPLEQSVNHAQSRAVAEFSHPSDDENEDNFKWRYVALGLASATLTAAGFLMPPATHNNNIDKPVKSPAVTNEQGMGASTPVIPETTAHALPASNLKSCAPIDAASRKATETIINAPNTVIMHPLGVITKGGSGDTPYSAYNDAESTFLTHQDLARKTGVTLHDPTRFLAPLEQDLNPPTDPKVKKGGPAESKIPLATYEQDLTEYLGEFGIAVTVGGHLPDKELGPQDTKNAVDIPLSSYDFQVKSNILHMIRKYSNMPQEFIDLSHDKHVVLINEDLKGIAAENVPTGNINTIYYNMHSYFDQYQTEQGDIEEHEETHGIARAVCGGTKAMFNDPEFISYNQDQGYNYSSFSNAPNITSPQYNGIVSNSDYPFKITTDRTKKNFVQACKDTRLYLAFKAKYGELTSFVSPYATKNVAEDQADTFMPAAQADANMSDRMNPYTPNVHAKFMLMMSRVMYYTPTLGRYMALLDARQSNTGDSYLLDECSQPLPTYGKMK